MRSRWRDEDGIALVTVLALATMSIIAVTTAVAYATNSLPRTRAHEDWNAALAAAEAGVEDVQARLNDDPSFYLTIDPDNEALAGWRDLPGGASAGSYHYRIDNNEVFRTGTLQVTSTGRVGDAERTVRAALRRRGFLDFIYFTDLEKLDPFTNPSWNEATARARNVDCAVHQPPNNSNANAVSSGRCRIVFGPNDVIDGPMHTNDAIMVQTSNAGPRFLGPVTSNWAGFGSGPTRYIRTAGSQNPQFASLRLGDYLPVPETGSELKEAARATGCVYRGPTYIRFHMSGSQAMMTVRSPNTPTNTAGPGCGPRTTALPVPSGEVLYVENSPSAVNNNPLGMNRANQTVGSMSGNRYQQTETTYTATYSATAGDVFVNGRIRGQLTIAAENDVVVVNDLVYDGGRDPSGSDMVGLVADNRVTVYHPTEQTRTRTCRTTNQNPCNSTNYNSWGSWSGYANSPSIGRALPPFASETGNPLPATPRTWDNPEIHAAILALNRSFHVQDFSLGGQLGTLQVYGAIAQKWRGPVALSGTSGYDKDYVYDWRLRNVSPPHFPVPEGSRWGPRTWAELDNPPRCTAGQNPITTGCLPA